MTNKNRDKQYRNVAEGLCSDYPTKYARLDYRAAFAFVGFMVLGNNVVAGSSLFVSSFLFDAPLCLEYLRYHPIDTKRKYLNYLAVAYHLTIVAISVLGILGIIKIVAENGTYYVYTGNEFAIPNKFLGKFLYFWLALSPAFVFCVVDWIINQGLVEKEITEQERGRRK